jgi:rhamnogalacturonan endolyase
MKQTILTRPMKTCCLLVLSLFTAGALTAQNITVQEQGDEVTISNGIVSVGFNKTNADILSLRDQKGKDFLGKKGRGYLLGPGFSMSPAQFKVVRKTNDLVELSFFHDASNHFQYDLHYVLRSGVSGVYCFLVQQHRAGDSVGSYGQTRWGLRSEENLYDYHLVRDSIQGPMPKMAELKNEIQDWTFRLADSSYYTKYDYADYIEDRYVHGMAGRQSGLGMFVIQAGHEYLNGGPTKQYQNVHSNPYLICMFNCGHFLSDIRKDDGTITDAWSKLSGPFLLYVNQGSNTDAIWKDAKLQAAKEVTQWPYAWMQHNDYPLARGAVQGTLLVNGQPAEAGTHIILAAPGYDWQAQGRGYIFSTRTTTGGAFSLPQVRPGSYTLYAYGSNQTEEFSKAGIVVEANRTTTLDKLLWTPPKTGSTVWQLGRADRKTSGFALSDHARNYSMFKQVPENIEFTMGKSKEEKDWYYAQTQNGRWTIHFTTSQAYSGNAMLTIALAGAARNPLFTVLVNDQPIQEFNKLGNDASVYRSAITGGYYQCLQVKFPGNLLKKGPNTISFVLKAKPGAGVMYDAVKLEAE